MKLDERHNGFVVKKATKVEEIHVRVLEILHEKSGAELIHIEADDRENLFGLCFKTYPDNDSGTPHVLEHTVLCGSERFPVQDPFFSMLSRSVHTFMNAFTAKTWTCYPASSLIEKDFYNLLDVYLDAVFHPLLRKESFQQEGHRLEFAKPEDPTSGLTIQGVVFNEMKGVFSSPGSLLWRRLLKILYPDSPYSYDSGGIPEKIITMRHEDLVNFHKEHYHPSRCTFFSYGNLDLKTYLDYLEKRVLHDAKKLEPLLPLEPVKRWTIPLKEQFSYPIQEKDLTKKTFIAFAWLTTDIAHQDELLALALLDSLLMDTDASILKKKLLSSGLCIQASSSYDPDVRDVPYAIILSGCEAENADLLESFLMNALQEIAKMTFPADQIEASLHQMEFERTEIGAGGEPYGLELFERTILPRLQGGPLLSGLKIHTLFERFHKLLANPDYLSHFIRTHFLNNNHFLRIVMTPDAELLAREEQKEKDWISAKEASLTPEMIATILKESKNLTRYREEKEKQSADLLPILTLQDIPQKVAYYPLEKHHLDRLTVYHHPCFTNNITYAELVFDLPQIQEEDLPFLRLFVSFLAELGAGGRSYLDNLEFIQSYIGNISASIAINVQKDNIQTCYPTLSISGKALERNQDKLFQLLIDMAVSVNCEESERIKELLLQTHSSLSHNLNKKAASYALQESAASFSPWNHISNIWYGLPYFLFIDKLVKNLDINLPLIIKKFKLLQKAIFHFNNPHLILSCDTKAYEALHKMNFYGIAKLSEGSMPFQPWVDLPALPSPQNKGKIIASQIAHNACSLLTVTINSTHAAPLKLASYLLDNLFIHELVREKGGAYGTGVRYNILTSLFQLYSSRDPNISSTYAAFVSATKELAAGNFTEQDLLEAKLSYIQDVDIPVRPGYRANVTYFQLKVGLTQEVRQEFRNRVLSTTREEIMKAATACLLPHIEGAVRTSYAGKKLFDSAAHGLIIEEVLSEESLPLK